MTAISIPVDWSPRFYQFPLWNYLEGGGKRAVAVWHRRAGKDATALNWTVTSAFQRPGLYWHLLPTYNQGRKIVWDGRTKEGRPFLSAWPKDAVRAINNTEMKLELENDSIWQVVGTDNVDRLVGANPVGCVFSEYSLQDPRAWDYIRPILAENGGWALFIYTPRGRNHGHTLLEVAKSNPKWYHQVLSVDDTGILDPAAIQEERDAGMPEEMIQQEYFCSFDAALVGSYYGQEMDLAFKDGRITDVPYDPRLEVHTAWDLGMSDSTAIVFYQESGTEIRIIDYYEASGEGLPHYIRILKEKGYDYGSHFGPHDIQVRDFSTGKSRLETAAIMGIKFKVAPKLGLLDGIDAVRIALRRMVFDKTKCARLIEAMRQYKKSWNDKMRCYSSHPDHDWTSHPADGMRTLVTTLKDRTFIKRNREATTGLAQYDPFSF